jgi:predicted nucleic acid-binding protein
LITVDASVAVKWVVAELGHEVAAALIKRSDLIAPDFLLIEAANALRRKVKDGEATRDQALLGLDRIERLVALVPLDQRLRTRAFEIALELVHPIYDCLYLALAEQQGSPLVTFDDELRNRAAAHGLGGLIIDFPAADT